MPIGCAHFRLPKKTRSKRMFSNLLCNVEIWWKSRPVSGGRRKIVRILWWQSGGQNESSTLPSLVLTGLTGQRAPFSGRNQGASLGTRVTASTASNLDENPEIEKNVPDKNKSNFLTTFCLPIGCAHFRLPNKTRSKRIFLYLRIRNPMKIASSFRGGKAVGEMRAQHCRCWR